MTGFTSAESHWNLPLSGNEPLHSSSGPYEDRLGDATVAQFWRWGYSRLMADVTRGVLAEYIVARLIGSDMQQLASPDREFDCLTSSHRKVEVKSTAFVQDWKTSRPTNPSFSGLKSRTYLDDDGAYKTLEQSQYHSDIFVFCVLSERDRLKVDPLNLDHWEFYVLTRSCLQGAGAPDAVSLSKLRQLGAKPCRWMNLKSCVEAAEQETNDHSVLRISGSLGA